MALLGTTRRAILSVAVMSLLAVPGILGMAQAHVFAASSTITISYSNGSFHGKVNSHRERCERNRTVHLFKVREKSDRLIGTTHTNDSGGWSISKPNANGRFYAKVTKRSGGRYAHRHTCEGDRSRVISV